jgi:hypothetical protein
VWGATTEDEVMTTEAQKAPETSIYSVRGTIIYPNDVKMKFTSRIEATSCMEAQAIVLDNNIEDGRGRAGNIHVSRLANQKKARSERYYKYKPQVATETA